MKISVIVPIYNVENYLYRCLESIDHQTFDDYEVLLINDGTKDRSGEIAKEYCTSHENFFYYEKENGGLGSARNYGIDRANGEYLTFIDSDDWVEEDFLLKLYNACCENKSDISMCGITRAWDNGTRQEFNSGFFKTETFDNVHEVIIKTSNVAWNKMYKKDLFNGVRYPDRITYEDMACTPRVMIRAKRITYIEDKLYNYFWREASITVSNRKKVNNDIITAFSILENSDLDNKVLGAVFLKVVMCSYLWSLYENDCEKILRRSLLEKYNGIYASAAKSYDTSLLNWRYRTFLRLCKTRKETIIKNYVKVISFARDIMIKLKRR